MLTCCCCSTVFDRGHVGFFLFVYDYSFTIYRSALAGRMERDLSICICTSIGAVAFYCILHHIGWLHASFVLLSIAAYLRVDVATSSRGSIDIKDNVNHELTKVLSSTTCMFMSISANH